MIFSGVLLCPAYKGSDPPLSPLKPLYKRKSFSFSTYFCYYNILKGVLIFKKIVEGKGIRGTDQGQTL